MLEGSPTASDEFGDDGFDWEAAVTETNALAETEKAVQAAAEREEEIQELVKEAEGELRGVSNNASLSCPRQPALPTPPYRSICNGYEYTYK